MADTPLEANYRQICTDPKYRNSLIEDPSAVISETYGCAVPDNVTIRVIEQKPGKITLVVPSPPDGIETLPADDLPPITRVIDLLYAANEGIGGLLIPSDHLKWILRDMRSVWTSHWASPAESSTSGKE